VADVDAIVIGSGAGGLAAAVALARAGKRVIVLEQHYLPGGWCHSFPLGGYRWSPGVHYIGELGPGGMARRIYEGLGLGGDLGFYEMSRDGFDHVIVGGEKFSIPAGRERFEERLHRRFPREREGITAYLDTTCRIGSEMGSLLDVDGALDALKIPFRAPTFTRWLLRDAKTLIDAHVREPRLAAILASQSGDHGLPPSLAPAPVHAAVVGHYIDGGYYPRGGAHSLPRAFILALKRAGGTIKVRTAVERILIEGGKAIGVRLAGGQELRAKVVISNADPTVTFGSLLGREQVPRRLRKKLDATRYSVSALSLFLGIDVHPGRWGFDSGNVWSFEHDDVDAIYRAGQEPWGREVKRLPFLFASATTLKDPSKQYGGKHTLEAFTLVGYHAFREWAESHKDQRPESYHAYKEELTTRMIDALDRIAPGIRDHVVFSDLGTPLTNEFYCAATGGNMYGTAKTRGQIGPWSWPIVSGIPGLYLCGASTLVHGVMGATISGLVAAKSVLGCKFEELLGSGPAITIASAAGPASADDPDLDLDSVA
jgi:all-trans-retinol 13,14-reductase